MLRKFILIIFTAVGFYYCLRLGYIWTAYGHGGQIMGIPFTLLMLAFTIAFFRAKNDYQKRRFFIIGSVYFLTFAGFSITIETIRETMDNYFVFLYYEPGGYVDEIFMGWAVTGVLSLFIIIKRLKKRYKKDELLN